MLAFTIALLSIIATVEAGIFDTSFRVDVYGMVYCDRAKTEVADPGGVTLMEADPKHDDVAEDLNESLGGPLSATMGLRRGYFEVAGWVSDGPWDLYPEPYLIVEGTCMTGPNTARRIKERYGLPCDFHGKVYRGIEIILDGHDDRPICRG